MVSAPSLASTSRVGPLLKLEEKLSLPSLNHRYKFTLAPVGDHVLGGDVIDTGNIYVLYEAMPQFIICRYSTRQYSILLRTLTNNLNDCSYAIITGN